MTSTLSNQEAASPQEGILNRPPVEARAILALALIILLGAVLRFTGIGWSLPDARHPLATYHPDELVDYRALQQVDITRGKLDIGFYNYGTLYFYLADLAQTIGHGYGSIPNTPAVPQDVSPPSPMEMASKQLPETHGIFLAARCTTALMGVLTIPVLFALGRRLYRPSVGLAAAFLYAIAPLAVVHAHFFTVDVGATLFVTLALLWSARILDKQNWKEYLVAGIWCGLAAAAKYSTGLVVAAPLIAHYLAATNGRLALANFKGVLITIAGTAVAFLFGCPGPLLNWDAFWNGMPNYPESGVRYELLVHPRLGHGLLFVNTGPGWWYHLVVSLRYGLGFPMLAIVLLGIITALRARTREDRLLLGFLLVFYGVTGLSAVRFARYMIPLYPAMCLMAARLIDTPSRNSIPVPLLRGITAFASALTLAYTVSLVRAMASEDPRDAAADYIQGVAAEGATVGFAKTPWYFSPPLSPWFGEMAAPTRRKCLGDTRYHFLLPAEGKEFDRDVLTADPDFFVLSNIETINEQRLGMPVIKEFVSAIPASWHRNEFAPPAIFDMAFGGATIPDDLLYVLPHVTVYSKK